VISLFSLEQEAMGATNEAYTTSLWLYIFDLRKRGCGLMQFSMYFRWHRTNFQSLTIQRCYDKAGRAVMYRTFASFRSFLPLWQI
jgi:hypothetical protein